MDNIAPQSPESPRAPDTLDSVTAFSRFEFELGKGNEGTKILMVEFEDADSTRDPFGKWHVSWPGMSTVLPADERPSENSRRLYFLLPPSTKIPPKIVLSFQPSLSSASASMQTQCLTINPLPAIFPPELGAFARASGKKGVLHTIWAKKRLQVLEKEIAREQEFNLEGIALEMALAEKGWIESNFGLAQKPTRLEMSSVPKYPNGPGSPTLATPRTPGGRKLSDKLRGLTLGTSDKELIRKDAANTPSHEAHPLSPESPDVAFSSFNSFRTNPGSSSTPAGQGPMLNRTSSNRTRQQQATFQMPSIDFVSRQTDQDSGDELFAKALNSRSPDLPKSPFSVMDHTV